MWENYLEKKPSIMTKRMWWLHFIMQFRSNNIFTVDWTAEDFGRILVTQIQIVFLSSMPLPTFGRWWMCFCFFLHFSLFSSASMFPWGNALKKIFTFWLITFLFSFVSLHFPLTLSLEWHLKALIKLRRYTEVGKGYIEVGKGCPDFIKIE